MNDDIDMQDDTLDNQQLTVIGATVPTELTVGPYADVAARTRAIFDIERRIEQGEAFIREQEVASGEQLYYAREHFMATGEPGDGVWTDYLRLLADALGRTFEGLRSRLKRYEIASGLSSMNQAPLLDDEAGGVEKPAIPQPMRERIVELTNNLLDDLEPESVEVFVRNMARGKHVADVANRAKELGVPDEVINRAVKAFGVVDESRDLDVLIDEQRFIYQRERNRAEAKTVVGERADKSDGPLAEWIDTIQFGDVLGVLDKLPRGVVRCVVTSPPYYKKRLYGIEDGMEVGQEPTLADYVQRLVEVFRKVRDVMTDDGTLWINLGDTYAGAGGGFAGVHAPSNAHGISAHHAGVRSQGPRSTLEPGTKPKDLLGVPYEVALALRADGWYWRAAIVWAKTSCVPENVRDRPTQAHEYIWLFSKSARYYYDDAAVAEPSATNGAAKRYNSRDGGETRNLRNVWIVSPHGEGGTHVAQMPRGIIEPCIKAGTEPGAIVLDPFSGHGTVPLVAQSLGRHWIGIDIVDEYVVMARRRLAANQPTEQLDALEAEADAADVSAEAVDI